MGDELQRRREELQQAWRQEVVEAIDQALAETSRLAEQQLRVQNELRPDEEPAASTRAEQAAIEEGVQKLMEQIKQAGGKNALISPQIAAALAAAHMQMKETRDAISRPCPTTGRRQSRPAGRWMISTRPPISCCAPGTIYRDRSRAPGWRRRWSAWPSWPSSRVAWAGKALASFRWREVAPSGNSSSVWRRGSALWRRSWRSCRGRATCPAPARWPTKPKIWHAGWRPAGWTGSVVERQERLFRRMLDAGRTLQGREEDQKKERQSTTATDDSVHLPPALRARLQGDDQQLRVPTWEELQQLSPEERRLVVDYFRHLSEPAPR